MTLFHVVALPEAEKQGVNECEPKRTEGASKSLVTDSVDKHLQGPRPVATYIVTPARLACDAIWPPATRAEE